MNLVVERCKSKKGMVGPIINQIINLIFTVLFMYPVIIFWIRYSEPTILALIVSLSLIPFFLPQNYFMFLQLSKSRVFYEWLLINKIQNVTQQGKFAKRITKYISKNENTQLSRSNLTKFKGQIKTFESYHYACLIFYVATLFYTIKMREFDLFIIIFVTNITYNIIPILIQQYNKSRSSNFIN